MIKVRSNSQHVAIVNLYDFAQFIKDNNVTIIK